MDLKRKQNLRCHTASSWPLYELSLFTCPFYIISILTGGQSWSLPWVLLLFIHDQIELQGCFFFSKLQRCSEFTAALRLYRWCYLFEYPGSDDAPVFSISKARHAVSQQKQRKAKRNNAAPCLIQTCLIGIQKPLAFFSTGLYINQHSLT